MSDSLWLHGLQHSRLPCPSPIPRASSNSCPSSQRCHLIISSSVILFSSCLQYFPASGSFQRSQFFTLGGQSIGVSASALALPMNIQDWSPLRWTGWISLKSKGLDRDWTTGLDRNRCFSVTLLLFLWSSGCWQFDLWFLCLIAWESLGQQGDPTSPS